MYRSRLLLVVILALFAPLNSALAEDPKEVLFIFQKQKDPELLKTEAELVGKSLSEILKLAVKTQVPGDYSTSVQAIVSKKADLAYIDSMSFILAERDGGAEILLAEQRKDPKGIARTDYDSIFVTQVNSPIKSVEQIISNPKEVRIVFTSHTSTSGYLIPFSRFVEAGIIRPKQDPKEVFKEASFAGSYDQALLQVIQDRADVAAVSYYTMEGTSADKYLSAVEREKLQIIGRTPGVPTHVLAVRNGLSTTFKNKLKQAIISLGKVQPKLFEDVYGTASFVEVEQQAHVLSTRRAAEQLGIIQPDQNAVAINKQ